MKSILLKPRIILQQLVVKLLSLSSSFLVNVHPSYPQRRIDRQVALNSLILGSMGIVSDRHSLSSFQNADQERLIRRFTSLSVEAIFDPRQVKSLANLISSLVRVRFFLQMVLVMTSVFFVLMTRPIFWVSPAVLFCWS